MPRKILVISAAFPPVRAGEADHAMYLCRHLAERGLDVHVLTTKRNIEASRFQFKVHPIMPHWLWPDFPRLARFLRNCSPDAILLIYSDRDYDSHPMITFAASLSKAFFPAVPFVTQLETEYIARNASLPTRGVLKLASKVAGRDRLDYVFGTLLLKSNRFIVLSERYLAKLSKTVAAESSKGVVIPPPPILKMCPEDNGMSRQRGRKVLSVDTDDFLFAYYGYIYEEKGIETLLKAFQTVSAERTNARLVMIGGGAGENHTGAYVISMRRLADALGVGHKIVWTGEYACESDEASLYLHAADACTLPFKHGVTLNRSTLAAAAAHGLPVITTRGSLIETPFRDHENLLLCPPQQPDSLAAAMAALMDDPELRQRLRAGALKLAAEQFSWKKAIDRTLGALGICQLTAP